MKKYLPLLLLLFFASISIEAQIFWANFNGNSIGSVETDGSNPADIINGIGGSPFAVAVDEVNQKVYYSTSSGIGRADLDGSNANNNFIALSESPYGMAIDQTNGVLYFSQFNNNRIGKVDLNGGNLDESFITGINNNPSGVAIDEVNGVIYWITYNNTAVGRVDLDGTSNRNNNLNSPGGQGIGIVVDNVNNKIIFSTRGANIYSADLDGSNFGTLISGQSAVHGLAIDPNAGLLYFNDLGVIKQANLDGSNVITVHDTGDGGNAWHIALFSQPISPPTIPTLSEWGLFLFGLIIFTVGIVSLYNYRKSSVGA